MFLTEENCTRFSNLIFFIKFVGDSESSVSLFFDEHPDLLIFSGFSNDTLLFVSQTVSEISEARALKRLMACIHEMIGVDLKQKYDQIHPQILEVLMLKMKEYDGIFDVDYERVEVFETFRKLFFCFHKDCVKEIVDSLFKFLKCYFDFNYTSPNGMEEEEEEEEDEKLIVVEVVSFIYQIFDRDRLYFGGNDIPKQLTVEFFSCILNFFGTQYQFRGIDDILVLNGLRILFTLATVTKPVFYWDVELIENHFSTNHSIVEGLIGILQFAIKRNSMKKSIFRKKVLEPTKKNRSPSVTEVVVKQQIHPKKREEAEGEKQRQFGRKFENIFTIEREWREDYREFFIDILKIIVSKNPDLFFVNKEEEEEELLVKKLEFIPKEHRPFYRFKYIEFLRAMIQSFHKRGELRTKFLLNESILESMLDNHIDEEQEYEEILQSVCQELIQCGIEHPESVLKKNWEGIKENEKLKKEESEKKMAQIIKYVDDYHEQQQEQQLPTFRFEPFVKSPQNETYVGTGNASFELNEKQNKGDDSGTVGDEGFVWSTSSSITSCTSGLEKIQEEQCEETETSVETPEKKEIIKNGEHFVDFWSDFGEGKDNNGMNNVDDRKSEEKDEKEGEETENGKSSDENVFYF